MGLTATSEGGIGLVRVVGFRFGPHAAFSGVSHVTFEGYAGVLGFWVYQFQVHPAVRDMPARKHQVLPASPTLNNWAWGARSGTFFGSFGIWFQVF